MQECGPARGLRSLSGLGLVSAAVSVLVCGHRSFCGASAELWNSLPMHVGGPGGYSSLVLVGMCRHGI